MFVHLTTPSVWRMGLALGALAPPSLLSEGFVHLSTPDQVALPANALFAGRDDLLALVVDPARLPGEVRWEPGRPADPPELRFPHLYGPLPTAAVTAVVPYRPGADGRFGPPAVLPAPHDAAARALAFDPSFVQRRAAAVVSVEVGFAVLDPRLADSYEHNGVWVRAAPADYDVDVDVVVAEADRVLGGARLSHRYVTVDDSATAHALAERGWALEDSHVMVLTGPLAGAPPADVAVAAVTQEVMAPLWQASWRRDIPGVSDATVAQLVAREAIADAVVAVVDLAVLDVNAGAGGGAGQPVASAQLRRDGATAIIDAVQTDPAHRGRGLAAAVMHDAVRRARAAGCDVVFLLARDDDWPRTWYARLGFTTVAHRFHARR